MIWHNTGLSWPQRSYWAGISSSTSQIEAKCPVFVFYIGQSLDKGCPRRQSWNGARQLPPVWWRAIRWGTLLTVTRWINASFLKVGYLGCTPPYPLQFTHSATWIYLLLNCALYRNRLFKMLICLLSWGYISEEGYWNNLVSYHCCWFKAQTDIH